MLLALVLHAAPALAGCDPKTLSKAVTDATPGGAAQAFLDLVACDKSAAKIAAPTAFTKILPGPSADKAVTAALQVGAAAAVRSWISAMSPDERSSYINSMGKACTQPEYAVFFLETAKSDPEKFWSERYYAGLDECRTPGVASYLEGLLAAPDTDRVRYESLLGIYASNLRAGAIPRLGEWLKAQQDAYVATSLVGAFPNAAGVGTEAGTDVEVAKSAVAAILAAAPTMPERSIEGARKALQSLGAETEADQVVVNRWRDRLSGGKYSYGYYVVKVATCKKDTKIEVHSAMVSDAGHTWPDTLLSRVQASIDKIAWSLPKDCTGSPEILLPTEPFKDQAAFDAWVKEQDTALVKKHAGIKPKVYQDATVAI